jgi:hypothetical protein
MKAVTLIGLFAIGATVAVAGAVPKHSGTVAMSRAPEPAEIQQAPGGAFLAPSLPENHSFYFTRLAYGGGGNFRGSRWSVDYPQADLWIINVLDRLTGIDVSPNYNVVQLDDPELRRFPFIYALEVGSMGLSPVEIQGLRDYLLAGGFLMIDDFWGSWEWENFEYEIRQVLPEYEIVELPLDHEIFSSYYQVDEIVQVPAIGNGVTYGSTHEQDGYVPRCLGIFDDEGRLMVVINWNTDLGDAWEHAENPIYPLHFSTYAYQMAANFIIYAMTH